MKPKLLLIGKNGQVGHELFQLLPAHFEVIALGREELNLAEPAAIQRAVRENSPHFIVNAAAYTAVDTAENDELTAHVVNAGAPGIMAEEAKQIGATIIHYSTDYVFDGSDSSPYAEADAANPVSVYGRTKFAGEEAIRATGVPHIILRTAWVYGIRGRNFLLTMLRLATQREELRVVRDQFGAPTWSRQIAAGTLDVLQSLIENESLSDRNRLSGTYHLTAAGETSWAGFASAILDHARAGQNFVTEREWFDVATGRRPVVASRVIPITTAEYLTPARRPAYSVLSNRKFTETFGVRLPDWRQQLQAVFTL